MTAEDAMEVMSSVPRDIIISDVTNSALLVRKQIVLCSSNDNIVNNITIEQVKTGHLHAVVLVQVLSEPCFQVDKWPDAPKTYKEKGVELTQLHSTHLIVSNSST